MKVLRNSDIDPAPLDDKRIAILGYGNQGRAQALNLQDSGHDVVVGLAKAPQTLLVPKPQGCRWPVLKKRQHRRTWRCSLHRMKSFRSFMRWSSRTFASERRSGSATVSRSISG